MCPLLWKAVEDEIVFCSRVNNCQSVKLAFMAFINTLHDYRKVLSDGGVSLDVKGAGWLAAFPEPNRAIQLLRNVSADAGLVTASGDLEAAADRDPFGYDFLGKAIDTGFRVGGFAAPERFVLSVQLARLLVSLAAGSGFDYPIRFDRPKSLKGVNGGEPYPVLNIDTMTHLAAKDIREKERRLLGRHGAPERDALRSYLEAYCNVVGTEEISLPLSDGDAPGGPPESYTKHKEKISELLQAERQSEFPGGQMGGDQDESSGEIPEGEGLAPLNTPMS